MTARPPRMEPTPVPRMVDFAPPPPERPDAEDFGWLELLRIFRRRLGLIVLVTVALTLAALPAILAMKREYTGATRILLLPPLGAAAASVDEEPPRIDVEVEIERLASRSMAEALIARFDLGERPEFNPAIRPVSPVREAIDWVAAFISTGAAPSADRGDSIDRVLEEVRSALYFYRHGRTDVVQIGFTSEDPALAGALPNALVDIYVSSREAQRLGRIDSADAWFSRQISSQRARVAAAKAARAAFVQRVGPALLATEGEEAATIDVLRKQGLDLSLERAGIAALLSEENPSIGALPSPAGEGEGASVSQLSGELRAAEINLASLRETLGNRHERVIEQEARVSELRASIEALRESWRRGMADREKLLASQLIKVEDLLDTKQKDISNLRLARRELDLLETLIVEEENAVAGLERAQRALEATRSVQGLEVEVLTPASVPLYPEGPGRKLYLAAAFLGAGLFALTLAGIVELSDRTVRGASHLRRIPGLIPAGLLPELSELETRSLLQVVRKRPDNAFAACIRGTASRLERLEGGNPPSSLVVTSVEEGDGRSTVARSLAIEWATRGRRVLLVDAGPTGQKRPLFPAAATDMGLTDLLRKGQGLDRLVRHDPVTGIDWLPRGTGPLLSDHAREGFELLLTQCRAKGIVAIFDAPAMQSVDAPLSLAAAADRTLLVVRWGRTRRDHADLATGMLAEVGVRDVAAVIAGVRVRRHALYGFSDRLSLQGPEPRARA